MNLWQALGLYVLALIAITALVVLSACTHGAEGSKISHQPAVIFCFLASCETELADRTAAPIEQDESTQIEVKPLP